ncbi:MAG: hypothetical protein Q7S64_00235 [bacterium]|nr:hypothetical protein [bacterium]
MNQSNQEQELAKRKKTVIRRLRDLTKHGKQAVLELNNDLNIIAAKAKIKS